MSGASLAHAHTSNMSRVYTHTLILTRHISDAAPEGTGNFVVVEVEVTTTVGSIDTTWDKLNEYDVNYKLATSCLPPAVVSLMPQCSAYGTPLHPDFIGAHAFSMEACCWSTARIHMLGNDALLT